MTENNERIQRADMILKSNYFLYLPNFFVLCLLLGSCKSLYDLKTYSKASVKGKIGGKDWAVGHAYTDPEAKLPDGMQTMIVLTTGKAKNACPDSTDKVADAREVAIAVDGKPGEMKVLSASGKYETEESLFTYKKTDRPTSIAFYNPQLPADQQYQFATSGKVKITKISKDVIEGLVIAKINQNEFINGKFKAKFCKYGQLN